MACFEVNPLQMGSPPPVKYLEWYQPLLTSAVDWLLADAPAGVANLRDRLVTLFD